MPGWRNRTLDGIPTPHPDYYTAILWRQLVGQSVLSIQLQASQAVNETFAVHAVCANSGVSAAGGVVLIYINLAKAPVQLTLSGLDATPRVEYVLTAPNGNLTADAVLLNGEAWSVNDEGKLPVQPVPGKEIPAGGPDISLPAASYGFLTFEQPAIKACAMQLPE